MKHVLVAREKINFNIELNSQLHEFGWQFSHASTKIWTTDQFYNSKRSNRSKGKKSRSLSLSLSAIHSPFKVNESSWIMGYWIDPILRLSLRVVEWFITNNNKILVILLKDKYSKNNQKVNWESIRRILIVDRIHQFRITRKIDSFKISDNWYYLPYNEWNEINYK